MWASISVGLMIGVFSSIHCVGMCGPLMLSISGSRGPVKERLQFILNYHGGRILGYVLIGVAAGFLNETFLLAGVQQVMSVLAGLVTIFFALLQLTNRKMHSAKPGLIQQQLSKLISTRKSTLALGLFNGLLPCGMVYLAVAAALATDKFQSSLMVMLSFGLATVPAMIALSVANFRLNFSARQKLRRFVPFLTCMIGVLLIVRGLHLELPFLGTLIHHEQIISCGQ